MFKLISKWWKYTAAKLNGDFDRNADPKVLLEQAISASQEQHKLLKGQAANVIANQKQTEIRLSRTIEDREQATNNARQALMMADEAQKEGNQERYLKLAETAELIAGKMTALDHEVESLKGLHVQASSASEQAKAAVNQNGAALQKKLNEQKKLLSQIDQGRMQQQLNTAMASLSESVGDDTPSFDEIRDKIELQYAKAKGVAELNETSVDTRMLEIEQATMNNEAQARLSELRTQLGLAPAQEDEGNLRSKSPAGIEPRTINEVDVLSEESILESSSTVLVPEPEMLTESEDASVTESSSATA